VGGLVVNDTDEQLSRVAILRVQSCLVLVMGETAEDDCNKSMRAELEGVGDGELEVAAVGIIRLLARLDNGKDFPTRCFQCPSNHKVGLLGHLLAGGDDDGREVFLLRRRRLLSWRGSGFFLGGGASKDNGSKSSTSNGKERHDC